MLTRQKEIDQIFTLLPRLGFLLDKNQPHMGGERFLVSPNKFVLMGRDIKTRQRVIIKISRLLKGRQEILEEKKARDILSKSPVLKKIVFFPQEIYFGRHNSHVVLVTEFIPQKNIFVSLPLEKQFSIVLKAFEIREKVHQTSKTFSAFSAEDYLNNFKTFQKSISRTYPTHRLKRLLKKASAYLSSNQDLIEEYCGYLVHADLVPHNFRVKRNSLFILDCTSFHFGNKYEEWARFLNYMIIHNPALEKKLKNYILDTYGADEYAVLRVMRIYKAGELIRFYVGQLSKTYNDLHALTVCRIKFWEEVMRCILNDKPMSKKQINNYIARRNTLRSSDEKQRQREFALA